MNINAFTIKEDISISRQTINYSTKIKNFLLAKIRNISGNHQLIVTLYQHYNFLFNNITVTRITRYNNVLYYIYIIE